MAELRGGSTVGGYPIETTKGAQTKSDTALAAAKSYADSKMSGNAGSATKLATARTIAISGGATGTATSFDGSGNISIPITALDPTKLSAAVAVNKGGTGLATLTAGQVLVGNGTSAVTFRAIDATTGGTASSTSLITSGAVQAGLALKSNLTSPTFTGTPTAPTAAAGTNTTQLATTAFVTAAVNAKTTITGNAGSATKLATARTIAISDGATGAATSFDGTGNISISITALDPTKLSTTVAVNKGGTGLATLTAGQVLVGNGTSAVTFRAIDATTGGTSASTLLITSGAVQAGLALKSNLVSPTFTGTPTAPTAATGTNTTQLATTAFVTTAVGTLSTLKTSAKTNVVAAVNELFQSASDGKTAIAAAITGKGVASTTADTFPQMATKIGQIQTVQGEVYKRTSNPPTGVRQTMNSGQSLGGFISSDPSGMYVLNSRIGKHALFKVSEGKPTLIRSLTGSIDLDTFGDSSQYLMYDKTTVIRFIIANTTSSTLDYSVIKLNADGTVKSKSKGSLALNILNGFSTYYQYEPFFVHEDRKWIAFGGFLFFFNGSTLTLAMNLFSQLGMTVSVQAYGMIVRGKGGTLIAIRPYSNTGPDFLYHGRVVAVFKLNSLNGTVATAFSQVTTTWSQSDPMTSDGMFIESNGTKWFVEFLLGRKGYNSAANVVNSVNSIRCHVLNDDWSFNNVYGAIYTPLNSPYADYYPMSYDNTFFMPFSNGQFAYYVKKENAYMVKVYTFSGGSIFLKSSVTIPIAYSAHTFSQLGKYLYGARYNGSYEFDVIKLEDTTSREIIGFGTEEGRLLN